ncbi:hypothetical protein NQK81_02190 [Amycolatopsis roodepoortensis]|uniref:hypothetical protein n=1 Tax=Amycolatopsis roodepoortensis TaxID=700274 RepID=UPI00214AA322|nr:hypothetical protein [Amycolatopsis roodepoortensis]UUV32284.1 hypothetical protein NQK81_02190 [Amycolatopsis roodepoortensis]
MIKAATVDRLGRNTIARVVDGAWSRRLVLQFLAGYDLIEGIRDALPWIRSTPAIYAGMEPDPGMEELGPFWFGPLRVELEPTGQVYAGVRDIDGPDEENLLDPRGEDPDVVDAFRKAEADRAAGYVEEVLPHLTRAGFRLYTSDGTPATRAGLARTINGTRLQVRDG